MDEPTTGPHIDDLQKLTAVLQELVEQGNTVAVIEHNLEIIKEADCTVALGPGVGEGGAASWLQGPPWNSLIDPMAPAPLVISENILHPRILYSCK